MSLVTSQMAYMKNSDKTKFQWTCRVIGLSIQSWWECKMAVPKENCMSVSYKKKYTITIWSTIFLGIYPREMEIFVHIESCNSPKLETFHISLDRWMVKQTVVCPCSGIIVPYEMKQTISRWKTWINLQGIMLSEKRKPKDLHTLQFYLYYCFEMKI